MATKVTKYQIENVNPSQLTSQGAIIGDALVAVPNPDNGGLTLVWSPTSVLPRNALQGQTLIYNAYTGTWTPSSINISGAPGTLPIGTGNDIDKVLTWNGFEWIVARPQGITSVGINTDSSLFIDINTTNPITSSGVFNIGLSSVPLPKLNQGGSNPGQVLTWNGSTNTWTPSAVTNYVAGVKAWVLFNGTQTVSIINQKNVDSITDHGQGDYTINFAANTFGSANYAFCTGINKNESGQYTSSVVQVSSSISNFRINTGFVLQSNTFNQFDASAISLVFFE